MKNHKQGNKQGKRVVLLVLLAVAILASATHCSSVSQPTTETPAPTHLGLAYYSERDGIKNQGAFYLLDLESREEQRLTRKDEIITLYSGFSWSPMARKFVYVAGLGGETEIYTVDVTGQSRQRLIHNRLRESFPVWSPDASQIAFLGRGILGESEDTALRAYVMNADGSEQRLLVDDPNVLSGATVWSPDGKQVALLATSYEITPGKQPVDDILIIDVASGKEVLRVADGNNHMSLAWSHAGDRLVFLSNQEEE